MDFFENLQGCVSLSGLGSGWTDERRCWHHAKDTINGSQCDACAWSWMRVALVSPLSRCDILRKFDITLCLCLTRPPSAGLSSASKSPVVPPSVDVQLSEAKSQCVRANTAHGDKRLCILCLKFRDTTARVDEDLVSCGACDQAKSKSNRESSGRLS